MLRIYISVFTIFTNCVFAMVQSQDIIFNSPYTSPAVSGTYTGSASAARSSASVFSQSTATSSGTSLGSQSIATATSNAQIPPLLPDPNIEVFAHLLLQLLLTSNVFGNFGSFSIYEPYEAIFDSSYPLLQRAGITDPSLADLVAQAAEDVGVLSSYLFYSTMSHMLANLIALEGALTPDVALNVPQKVMTFVEKYANENGVVGTGSVLREVQNGFYDFVDSFGLISIDDFTIAFPLFAEIIKGLAN